VVCGLGLWTVLDRWDMFTVLQCSVYQVSISLVIITGAVSVVVALIGYAAVAFESRTLLAWYTIFLVVIFVAESISGLLSYVYQENLGAELQENLHERFVDLYKTDDEVRKSVDIIQEKFSCCGSESYQDWSKKTEGVHLLKHINTPVPDSCCKTPSPGCGVRDHPSNIHYTGCRHRLQDEMSGHLIIISIISVSIALLQILGISLTVPLFSALNKRDKYMICNNNGEARNWNSDNSE